MIRETMPVCPRCGLVYAPIYGSTGHAKCTGRSGVVRTFAGPSRTEDDRDTRRAPDATGRGQR